MQQFIVPQFIDVESKIIGPITARQFVISLLGLFAIVIAYKLADTALFIIESLIIAAIVVLFGFIKVNGRPFHDFLLNFLETFTRPQVRVWQVVKQDKVESAVSKGGMKKDSKDSDTTQNTKELNKSRLKEIALIVDTGGQYRRAEDWYEDEG